MNICIIGGSGFIGTSLSKNLIKKKNKFLIIDKTKSEKYPDLVQIANVRNIESLRKRIPDNSILINLAAEHRDDVKPISLYKEVNVNGAKNICIVAREKNIKKIDFGDWLKDRTFKVNCKRIGNQIYSTQDLAAMTGEYIIDNTKAKVSMTDPDIVIYMYIYNTSLSKLKCWIV